MTDHPNPKVKMAELTAGEARDVLAGDPLILLPLGSHEDQGPHAPMGDFMAAGWVAETLAGRLHEQGLPTYVAPTLPFGAENFFAGTLGGMALSQDTMRKVLDDLLESLVRNGLRRIIVLNGHGGNTDIINGATRSLYRETGVLAPSIYLWQSSYGLLRELLGPERAARSSGHGADPLTSVYLHYAPELVRADMVPDPVPPGEVLDLPMSGFGSVRFAGLDVHMPVGVERITPNGVLHGDARLSSAETGAMLVERLVSDLCEFSIHFHARSG